MEAYVPGAFAQSMLSVAVSIDCLIGLDSQILILEQRSALAGAVYLCCLDSVQKTLMGREMVVGDEKCWRRCFGCKLLNTCRRSNTASRYLFLEPN